MKDFVLDIFVKANFIELLFFSLFLLTLPITLYWKATDALRRSSSRKGNTLRGTAFAVGAILIVVFDLWVVIVLGADIVNHAQAVFGPTLLVLFLAVAGSIVLLSVSYTGRLLRTTWGGAHSESGQSQKRERGRKILAITATAGVIGGGVLLASFAPVKPALAGILLMAIALIFGWSGGAVFMKPW